VKSVTERVIDNFGPEDAEHYAVVQWCEWNGIDVFHVPNSTYTKSIMVRTKNALLGVKSGIPDLWFPIAGVGMVVIEMKRQNVKGSTRGRASQAQIEWMEKLNKVPGVQAFLCEGAEEAVKTLLPFLPTKPRIPFLNYGGFERFEGKPKRSRKPSPVDDGLLF
jgi:hypothetical protein